MFNRKTAPVFLLAVSSCLLLSSCASSRFEKAWTASLSETVSDSSPTGPWTGKWTTKTNGHAGGLRCLVTKVDKHPEQLQFWYHATWGKGFSAPFKVKYKFVRTTNNHFKIKGSRDLGIFGSFKHEADITPSSFTADYSNKKGSLGSFELVRPSSP